MKQMIGLATVVGLFSTLVSTNPGQDAYTRYTTQRMMKEVEVSICYDGDPPTLMDEACGNILLGLGTWQRDNIEQIIQLATTHRSYLLYSTYQTQLPLKTYRAIGLMGTFIPI